jgi:hypothetical protein
VPPRAQRAGASRAGECAGGEGGLGLAGVGDPDTVGARRTSMVCEPYRWEGPTGAAAGPAGRLDPRGRVDRAGLGTLTTPGAARVCSGWKGLVVVTVATPTNPRAPPAVVTINGTGVAGRSSSREAVNIPNTADWRRDPVP